MKTETDKDSLQKKVENKRHELHNIRNDIDNARKQGYDLGPFYMAKINAEKELEKLEQELEKVNKDHAPRQMLYDRQSVLATSLIRRRNRLGDASVTLKDKTTLGDCYRSRKDLKSSSINQQSQQKSQSVKP